MNIIEDSEINILSLPCDIKRRDFMRLKLDNVGIKNYSFLDAIHGEDKKELYKLYLKHVHSHKKVINGGINAFGCFLSYTTWFLQKACDRSQIIFEDDIYFHKDFWNIVNNLPDDLTRNYNIIYLGYNQQKFSDKQYLALDTNQPMPISNKHTTYGTFGIFYTCKAVSILRDYFEELCTPLMQMIINFQTIDYTLWKAISNKLKIKTLILNPPLVIPEVRSSTIRTDARFLETFYAGKYINLNDYSDIELYEKFI